MGRSPRCDRPKDCADAYYRCWACENWLEMKHGWFFLAVMVGVIFSLFALTPGAKRSHGILNRWLNLSETTSTYRTTPPSPTTCTFPSRPGP